MIEWDTVTSSTSRQGTKAFLSGLRTRTPSSDRMTAGRRQVTKTRAVSTPSTAAAIIDVRPL